MKPMRKNKKGLDIFNTPTKAVDVILKYIPKNKVIWECTNGDGAISKYLEEKGYTVIKTDIRSDKCDFGGLDFLKNLQPPKHYDIILTNPPYSYKTQFLERAYKIGKPFYFLLPITTLEGMARSVLFRKYGINTVILDRRVNYIKGKSVQFNSSWFFGNHKIHSNRMFFEKYE